ncbi:hypothetical protein [Helicobacter salomonis]|uniref:hypothetical protein n=1 Tax=Helicobacter salomonis TaxID=56878 RepID=UPI0018F83901|nr:hypothetical protein [Helicobacter salomonis]
MPLIWDRSDKQYKRFVAEKRAQHVEVYKRICAHYHLEISQHTLLAQAHKYAKHEADSHFQVFSDAFKGDNLFTFIGSVMRAIMGVVMGTLVSVFSFGAATPLGISIMVTSIAGALADIASTITSLIITDNAKNAQSFYTHQSASLERASTLGAHTLSMASVQTTELLIYNPYAIFPEGSIYKDENPGSLGYRAGLEAPHCMKGIVGTKAPNPLAEQLSNRAHKHLAGNAQYDPLQLPFPVHNFQENTRLHKQILQQNLKARILEIQKGFAELAGEYFGAFDDMLPRLFNQHEKKFIHPRTNQLNTYDFLEKMRYYPKGERLPLFEHLLAPEKLKALKNPYRPQGYILLTQTAQREEEERKEAYRVKSSQSYEKTIQHHYTDHYTYSINYEGKIVALKRDVYEHGKFLRTQHLEEKKGQSVVLQRKEVKPLPNKPPQAWHYENIQANEEALEALDPDTLLEMEQVYENYLVQLWDGYEIEVLNSFPTQRPLASVQALGLPMPDLFFNSVGEELTPLELEKKALFEEFVQAQIYKRNAELRQEV